MRNLRRHITARPFGARFKARLNVGAGPLPPELTNLKGWYKADAGVTEISGKVSQWDDQSGNDNHLVQGTAGQRFTNFADNQGRKGMLCVRASATNMTAPAGMAWDKRAASLFIVATFSTRTVPLSSIVHFGGLGTDGEQAAIQNRTRVVAGFDGAAKSSTIRHANVNTLIGFTSGASATTVYDHGIAEAIAHFSAGSGTGGTKIGNSTNPATLGVDGAIREVFIYDKELSAAAVASLETYVNSRWGVGPERSNYVFFDGNSITQGQGAESTVDMFPVQLTALQRGRYTAWNVTNGAGQLITDRDTAAVNDLDPSIDGTKTNIVVMQGAGNDLLTLAEATVLTNLETYCDNRRLAGADKVIVTTVPDRVDLAPAVRNSYNAALRLETFYDGLIDLAGDSRLSDDTDTTYYDPDRVHFNPVGYGVVAELAAPIIAANLTS